jgi:hypothetical protein
MSTVADCHEHSQAFSAETACYRPNLVDQSRLFASGMATAVSNPAGRTIHENAKRCTVSS